MASSPSLKNAKIMPEQTLRSFHHTQIPTSFYTKEQEKTFYTKEQEKKFCNLGHVLGKKMPLVSI
jgi:hypothetical protein